MAITITVDGTDVTDKVRLDGWRVEMAANQGQVGTGRLVIDDTTGTAELAPPATEWSIVASEATPTTIGGGFIGEAGIDKGPLTAGTERQFGPVLEDWNTALTDRVLKGNAANRPEETDYQRINWLLGQAVTGMLDGAGQVPNTNTVTMDPTNYRGKTPLDVLDDCAESAGKNYFVYYESGTGWVLYYDKTGAATAAFTSDLQLSDDPTEVDSSTIYAMSNVDYEVDPERIYAVLNVKWANGWIYEQNASTVTTYRNLQKTVIKENIKKASRARAWAQRQLAKLNEPTKRLECTVTVPESALGELRAGYRIEVKLRSRGITGFTYFRIAQATISPAAGRGSSTDVLYDVRLKMFDKLRPVNLDDSYGGGDSSGSRYTGPSIPPIGGDTGGGGGSASSTSEYVLDDFSRATSTLVWDDDFGNRSVTPAYNPDLGTPSDIGTGYNVGALGSSSYLRVGVSSDQLYMRIGSSAAGTASYYQISDDGSTGLDFSGDQWTATWKVNFTSDPQTWWYLAFMVNDGTNQSISTTGAMTNQIGGRIYRTSSTSATVGVTTDGNGTVVWSDSSALTLNSGTDYRFRVQRSGTSIKARLWADGATEPSSWDIEDTITDDQTFDKTRFSIYNIENQTTPQLFDLDIDDLEVNGSGVGPRLIDTGSSGLTVGSYSSGTESINLPDGMSAGNTIVAITQQTGTTEDLAGALEAAGFTAVSEQTLGTNKVAVLKYTLTGSEGWGDGTTLDWVVTSSGSYRVAMWLYDGAADVEAGYSASVDPPSLDPSWDDAIPTDYWAYGFSDTGVLSGTPTGYTLYGSGASGIWYRESTKQAGTGGAENPSTYGGGGGNDGAFTIAIGGTAASGWGSIPTSDSAPWEGGNDWDVSVLSGSASAYIESGAGILDLSADDSSIRVRTYSDTSLESDDQPWGPWTDGAAEFVFKVKVNPLGDLADTDPNDLYLAMVTPSGTDYLRVLLGDDFDWNTASGGAITNATRGFIIANTTSSTTYSDFVPISLAADTYYYIRWNLLGNTARAKMWLASDPEPIAWQAEVARADYSTSDYARFSLTFTGNDGMSAVFDQIDASLSPATGGIVSTSLPPGDGSTTTWNIEPYIGSIVIFVDGIQTPPASIDRDAGTFTFDRAPADGAVIRVEYTPL
jgi:hypothetical protein